MVGASLPNGPREGGRALSGMLVGIKANRSDALDAQEREQDLRANCAGLSRPVMPIRVFIARIAGVAAAPVSATPLGAFNNVFASAPFAPAPATPTRLSDLGFADVKDPRPELAG
jgi:hypothetical protein